MVRHHHPGAQTVKAALSFTAMDRVYDVPGNTRIFQPHWAGVCPIDGSVRQQENASWIEGLAGGDLEVTAIPVNHIVPTTGLLLRQAGASTLFTSDTGPTERIWEVANQTEDLAAVITECSFPNRLQDVADVSLHLSPQSLAAELRKLKRDVPVYLYHFKPPYVEELRAELAATDVPHPVTELEQDRTYDL